MREGTTAFRQHYTLVKVFDATQRLEEQRNIFGKDYLLVDATFKVYQRKDTVAGQRARPRISSRIRGTGVSPVRAKRAGGTPVPRKLFLDAD